MPVSQKEGLLMDVLIETGKQGAGGSSGPGLEPSGTESMAVSVNWVQ